MGDAASFKPINAEEAVAENKKINENLLTCFDWTGNFTRIVGKDGMQTLYTFTRDIKPKDKSRKVDSKHEFIQYLLKLENGELDTEVLYSYTRSFEPNTRPEISIYDTVTIKYNNKPVDTTVGRLIFNKVIFGQLWDRKDFYYINVPVKEPELISAYQDVAQLFIEGKTDKNLVNHCVEMATEFGLRLATVYNASITMSMMSPDKEFIKYRDDKLNAIKEQVLEKDDVELMDNTIKDIIEYSKKHFKDDDMIELYESENKAKWGNDFKALNISMGALPKLTGGRPSFIFEALNDGIPLEHYSEMSNTSSSGALARGMTMRNYDITREQLCVIL